MRGTTYFIRKKVKRLVGEGRKRPGHFCTLQEARRILVLFDAEDRSVVEPCLDTLRRMEKDIRVCMYLSGDAIPEVDSSYQIVQAKRDLNMWYMPPKAVQEKFCACEADILIDLTRGENYVMQYLLLKHPAAFKVGAKSHGLDLYDLTLSVVENTDIKDIFGHLIFYLQTIRSK